MTQNRVPSTLDQLPATAGEYYRSVTKEGGLFRYVYIGKDDCGRRVYQKYLDGEKYGRPRALLTYREYKKAVRYWVNLGVGSMGVTRWADPYYSEPYDPVEFARMKAAIQNN